MKCFHFANGSERRGGGADEDGLVSRVASRVSWARSLSVASSSSGAAAVAVDPTRRSEFDLQSADFPDSFGLYGSLAHPRANDLRIFTFVELKSATRGFNKALIIGEGGFGCVYRGVIDVPADGHETETRNSKMDVAVKQLNRQGLQGHKEWINEVNFLGVVKHPNLVKLVGYCADDDERGMQRLLVYELMQNKSLDDHLLRREATSLPWITRLKIAQDAARGLAYLHEEMDFQLIFRDLKSSNILLDEEFRAKLSDFGLAREGPPEGLGHVSTSIVGTVGYAAPEYLHTGRLTAKSDVWSFGVVLYELITGRRAVDRNLPKGEQKLLEWARPYMSDSKKLHTIMDPRLEGRYCIKSAHKLSALANRCLMKQPKSRPKMSEVVDILEGIIDEALSKDESIPPPVEETDHAKEKGGAEEEMESESIKQARNYLRKKVFDIREKVNLRNKSLGKLDWRNWTPSLVRTM